MATAEYYATGETTYSALSRTQWSDILHEQVQDKLYFESRGFIGPDEGDEGHTDKPKGYYPIVQKTELGKNEGDKIVMGLRRKLSGAGVTGATALVDSEEQMLFYDFAVYLELFRNGTGWQSKMSPQRNKFHTKEAAGEALSDWMADKLDESAFDTFVNGFSDHLITELTACSTTTHPNVHYAGAAAAADDVTSTDVFNTAILERMATWAEDNNINPVSLPGGEEGFVAIIHPYQLHNLRQDTYWREANQHGQVRGMKNPIFSRSEGTFAGVYIHTARKTPNCASTVSEYLQKRQAILMGAHSIARAYGSKPTMNKRKEDDYGRYQAWDIEVVMGDARADWTSDDGNSTKANQSSSLWVTYAANPNG